MTFKTYLCIILSLMICSSHALARSYGSESYRSDDRQYQAWNNDAENRNNYSHYDVSRYGSGHYANARQNRNSYGNNRNNSAHCDYSTYGTRGDYSTSNARGDYSTNGIYRNNVAPHIASRIPHYQNGEYPHSTPVGYDSEQEINHSTMRLFTSADNQVNTTNISESSLGGNTQ